MRKLDINFLAAMIVVGSVMCFIAVLHYTSFERHHTHDWPSNQTQTQQTTDHQNNVPNETLVPDTDRIKSPSPSKPSQSTGAYPSDQSLQHYDHKAQIIMAGATVFGLAVAVFGLILIGRTLSATRTGTVSVQDTLVIAKDSYNLTRDTTYKELRAYLGIRVDAVPIVDGMENLAVNSVIYNHGQTPAYNIRLVYSLYNGMAQWGPTDNQTTAILNPGESFSPRLASTFKNADSTDKQETIFLNLDIVFTDMNGQERWLKVNFSKPGKQWPRKQQMMRSPRHTFDVVSPIEEITQGTTELYLVKMETGDLEEDAPYNM